MIWDVLINNIKDVFINQTDKKEWLDKLVENIENQKIEDKNVPFKIVDIKDKGFLVKVSGLYAFISYKFMPWRYNEIDYWKAVYPKLLDKVFFCKIYEIKKDPLLITINAAIPQFKKLELIVGKEYVGLIIKVSAYGVFIDIGYHFGWRCGSMVGLLHKSQFGIYQSILDFNAGDEIQVLYQGLNDNGQLVFSKNTDLFDWESGIPQGLIDQKVWVQIVRLQDEKAIKFLVNGKYKGYITFSKKDYPIKYSRIIKQFKEGLADGAIVNCEVIGCNCLVLK